MRVFALVGLMLFPAAALGACGSSNATDLFSNGGSAGAADSGSATDATGTGNPETPTGDSGTAADGGKKKDAGGGPVQDDSGTTPTDAGGGPETSTTTDPGIFCGVDNTNARLYCDVSNQACCISSHSGSLSFDCHAASGTGSQCNGLRVPCDDQADCNGQICCATYDKINSGYKSVQCQSSCGADTALTTEYRLCDPNAAVDECAAVGGTCQPSTAIDGWFLCKK